jgi:glutaminyl-tRNA synthetase
MLNYQAEFRLYDRLFTLENPGKNDHFEQLLNPKSLVVTYGIVEPSMKDAKPELAYQFEREGYFCHFANHPYLCKSLD